VWGGTGWDGKAQTEEDDHRRYGYKDLSRGGASDLFTMVVRHQGTI
jgi:hypothetical protein